MTQIYRVIFSIPVVADSIDEAMHKALACLENRDGVGAPRAFVVIGVDTDDPAEPVIHSPTG